MAQLAGVGLASAVLHTAVGLMVFLAYSTTPAVARAIGNGQLPKALAAGRDGVWLALLLGMVLAAAGFLAAEPLVDLMGASGEVRAFAVDYLRWSMPGLVAMLLIFAGTGVLRGLQDTRTPLLVAAAGFTLNIVLNLFLVYGLQLVRRRLGHRHQHRPVGHGPGLRGDGPAQCPQPRRVPAAGLARHPGPEPRWARG